ncbi:aquaporin [Acidiferrimicrobium sp. IK]|uniref:MIP/aquaporin family protein n=1 Tax=Acidiferrimicrobium sp. IK TaxID=2871700 RepID=UPI0021CB765C|nr:aquaporin [Acidiferrimicrobium sp. IK]MCU4186314.1 aquaporin [Acidiferrimicrobium sp. IK]
MTVPDTQTSAAAAVDTGGRRRAPLSGPGDRPSTAQPKAAGWHPVEWACEFGGTAFQLFVGFGAVAAFESSHSPLRADLPAGVRLAVIGAIFGLLGAAVAVSPAGKRSGAHLNPAVTLAFALRGHTGWRDVAGFVAGQVCGALLAAAAFSAAWRSWASSVHTARTIPEAGLPGWGVVAVEAGLAAGLILTILTMLSSSTTARWTPLVVTGALAGLIWAGAPETGASMNPARTFGPDLVAGNFAFFWAYLAGPLTGATVAVVAFRLLGAVGALGRDWHTLTAKLFHDPDYPSIHATALPAQAATPSPGRPSG